VILAILVADRVLYRVLLELFVQASDEGRVPGVHSAVAECVFARLDEVRENKPVAHIGDGLTDLLRHCLDVVAALLNELPVRLPFFERMNIDALKVLHYLHFARLDVREFLDARGNLRQSRFDARPEPSVARDDFVFRLAAFDRSREDGNDDALLLNARDQLVELSPLEFFAARIGFRFHRIGYLNHSQTVSHTLVSYPASCQRTSDVIVACVRNRAIVER